MLVTATSRKLFGGKRTTTYSKFQTTQKEPPGNFYRPEILLEYPSRSFFCRAATNSLHDHDMRSLGAPGTTAARLLLKHLVLAVWSFVNY